MARHELLRVEKVSKRFGKIQAVNSVSFSIFSEELTCIIGPNGSGKTTLFNLISGHIKPDNGSIILNGENIAGLTPDQICKRGIARTFQMPRFFSDLNVFENIVLGAYRGNIWGLDRGIAEERARSILKLLGLNRKAGLKPYELTLFERKLLGMAAALATEPSLLLLDEVMAGLSSSEMTDFVTLLKSLANSGINLVVIEHVMRAVVQLAERIIVMADGEKIADGKPKDVINDAKVIKVYLGENVV